MLKPFYKTYLEAGVDEAGRGCLAGPVTAAAVILPKNFSAPLLNDSKKLTKKQRDDLRLIIEEKALAYAVAHISPKIIDNVNILNATFLAMHTAIDGLKKKPKALIIDGNRFNSYKEITHYCIIKGDGKYAHIAAASVLAKTYRDELMQDYHEKYPNYDWYKNKGYPTAFHRSAISEFGITPYHRKSFQLLNKQLHFDL